jgi:hypothetical protein
MEKRRIENPEIMKHVCVKLINTFNQYTYDKSNSEDVKQCNICKLKITKINLISPKGYPIYDPDSLNPEIEEHVELNHPEYCYRCSSCNLRFANKYKFNDHECEEIQYLYELK